LKKAQELLYAAVNMYTCSREKARKVWIDMVPEGFIHGKSVGEKQSIVPDVDMGSRVTPPPNDTMLAPTPALAMEHSSSRVSPLESPRG
jgi:hypothetical protein